MQRGPVNQPSKLFEDDVLAREIEAAAVQMAQGAGDILAAPFGQEISIEYKDKEERDPVTEVDKACQEYLVGEISGLFPDHSILGEEESEESKKDTGVTETPCGDFLWVLDPLDGTTNFLNGLPVYAVSVGVLHRGRLLAGAQVETRPAVGAEVHGVEEAGAADLADARVGVGDALEPLSEVALRGEHVLEEALVAHGGDVGHGHGGGDRVAAERGAVHEGSPR